MSSACWAKGPARADPNERSYLYLLAGRHSFFYLLAGRKARLEQIQMNVRICICLLGERPGSSRLKSTFRFVSWETFIFVSACWAKGPARADSNECSYLYLLAGRKARLEQTQKMNVHS